MNKCYVCGKFAIKLLTTYHSDVTNGARPMEPICQSCYDKILEGIFGKKKDTNEST